MTWPDLSFHRYTPGSVGTLFELALDALELGPLRLGRSGFAPMLAHGALECGPAAAFAFEALGGVGVGFGIAVALGIEAEPKALHAARVGRPEAVVGEAAPAALFLYHIAFEGALM